MICILASDREQHPEYLISLSVSSRKLVDHSVPLDYPKRGQSDHLPGFDQGMKASEQVSSGLSA